MMNIFESLKEWQNYYLDYEKELNKLSVNSAFSIIDNLIQFFFQKKNSILLVVLDHYSSIYDKNNEFKKLRKKCLE